MQLITMAHLGEALGVIEKFKLKTLGPDLYGNDQLTLLITGEGPFEAAVKTAATLPTSAFTRVINLGIAGSLNPEHKIGDILEVRTLYLVNLEKPQFKTFQCSSKGFDCITSFERILDGEKASQLKGLGQIVDREAWGVAFATKNHNLPISSYKLISDQAGTLSACELVKENAADFSYALAQKLEEILDLKIEKISQERISLPGFHFTFSTTHRFQNLLNKISIKEDLRASLVMDTLNLQSYREKEISPKDRTRLLMDDMETRIDPTRKILQETTRVLTKNFQDKGIKLQLDPQWENPKVTISLEVANDQELKSKIKLLSELSIAPFTETMKGQFHVE